MMTLVPSIVMILFGASLAHSARVVTYNCNMFITQATGEVVPNKFLQLSMIFESEAKTYPQISNRAKKCGKNKHSSFLCRTFRDEENSDDEANSFMTLTATVVNVSKLVFQCHYTSYSTISPSVCALLVFAS
jgi:hypothetical protein